MNIILYGPPGAGKSAVGKELAARLKREWVDTDSLIESRTGLTIPQIFSQSGEAEFRRLESGVCAGLARRDSLIIALGGGALLDPANRAALERRGLIICLRADSATLLLRAAAGERPLLEGGSPAEKLNALLESRRALYESFPAQIDTTGKNIPQIAGEIESMLAPRTLPVNAPGLEHEILLGYGLLENLPTILAERGLTGPTVIVTDENVVRHITPTLPYPHTLIPAGETHKTLDTVGRLYDEFLVHGMDRSGIVIAVGGGVVGDLAGFAAATFMRGARWVNVPTTLLAMVDASLGGKTGVDRPQGKNLVGAFHPPALVVSDPLALNTLPKEEYISGLAEVIKHGIIGDVELFEMLEHRSPTSPTLAEVGDFGLLPIDQIRQAIAVKMLEHRSPTSPTLAEVGDFGLLPIDQIRQAIAVKITIVEADPFERGERAKLNFGHTIGHGVEAASGYRLRHGEAVAIGMAAEAWIAEQMGLAEGGLTDRLSHLLKHTGLPTRVPGLDPAAIRAVMNSDKKKTSNKLKFALPKRVGEAVRGVEVDEALIAEALEVAANG